MHLIVFMTSIYIYICVCVCVYIYIYIFIYIYIYIYTHTYIERDREIERERERGGERESKIYIYIDIYMCVCVCVCVCVMSVMYYCIFFFALFRSGSILSIIVIFYPEISHYFNKSFNTEDKNSYWSASIRHPNNSKTLSLSEKRQL